MNTIDYIADGQSVQFSKKAVTINGEEFAYIGMSAIKHSAAKRIYLFKYDFSSNSHKKYIVAQKTHKKTFALTEKRQYSST